MENKEQKLKDMNLKWGSTYVYRIGEKYFAWGDIQHCPQEDILHNIQILKGMLDLEKNKINYIGKSYDINIYKGKITEKNFEQEKEKLDEMFEISGNEIISVKVNKLDKPKSSEQRARRIYQMIADSNMLIVDMDCIGGIDLSQAYVTEDYMVEKLIEVLEEK